jgi:hypothetical protein
MALEEFLIGPDRKIVMLINYKRSEIASFLAHQTHFEIWPTQLFWFIFLPTYEKGWPPLL